MALTFQLLVAVLIISSHVAARSYQDFVLNEAKSTLHPGNNAAKSSVKGTVKMIQFVNQVYDATYFKIEISGLPPNSMHGFHIHEHGDIVTAGCKSTGEHYNPFNKKHGAPTDKIRHVGDLGNVYADSNGNVREFKQDFQVSLVGDYSVVGRAFVLHELPDDLGKGGDKRSKTTGNSGARIACGVIVGAPGKNWRISN